ncbi:MAG: TdeIII family type II restriction endonuclease [Dehalococcoidales bacterium]|nr:TdeIII family type II restriction endonuclease [Dehalococcoidales bacterium]
MGLTNEQIINTEQVLKDSLRYKFNNYSPEPASMPFHTRLLGKDRMALFSFIHSLNTTFGTTVFEPVAEALAKPRFKNTQTHTKSGKLISEAALFEIQKIMNNLETTTTSPNKMAEIESIRKVCQTGQTRKVKPTLVDLLLETSENELFLFDLKTAKPNAGGFKEYKRTLLEWVAAALFLNPNAKVNTLIAIPYNPYEPEPYERWTIMGMLDMKYELKVAEEFWDFIGGQGTYKELLDCFERVGIELRDEIDQYFIRFNK